jgi:hypothetical protein
MAIDVSDPFPGLPRRVLFAPLHAKDASLSRGAAGHTPMRAERHDNARLNEAPVVTETKPVVTETKPVVTETKPVVTETKPVVTETHAAKLVSKPSLVGKHAGGRPKKAGAISPAERKRLSRARKAKAG